jgi:hypothetical protein
MRAADLAPVITELQASSATSLRAIASALNDRGIPTARGGKWFAASVRDVLARKSVRREGTVDAGPERWQLFLRPGRRQRPYAHHKDGHGGGPSTVDMRSLPS